MKINNIKEIVILNGHKDYKVKFNNSKIKSIDNWVDNDKYYLLRRYKNVNYKRLCSKKGYYTKSKNYNYILPGLCLTSKEVINNIWKNIKKNTEFMNLVIEQKGNCEDLLFNYEFNKIYKKNPKYIKGKFISLDKENGFYTNNTKKHLEIRNNFCQKINKT